MIGWALLGLGLGALLSPRQSAGSKVKQVAPMSEVRKEARAQLRSAAEDLEKRGVFAPGFADFVDATALTESAWNPFAGGLQPGSNKAQGILQMRPKSAGDTPAMRELLRAHPILLTNPRFALACASAYWWRMMDPVVRPVTWERLRASFAYPYFIRGRAAVVKYAAKRGTLNNPKGITPIRYDAAMKRFRGSIARTGNKIDPEASAYPPSVKAYKGQRFVVPTPSGRGTVNDFMVLLGLPTDLATLQSEAIAMEEARGV